MAEDIVPIVDLAAFAHMVRKAAVSRQEEVPVVPKNRPMPSVVRRAPIGLPKPPKKTAMAINPGQYVPPKMDWIRVQKPQPKPVPDATGQVIMSRVLSPVAMVSSLAKMLNRVRPPDVEEIDQIVENYELTLTPKIPFQHKYVMPPYPTHVPLRPTISIRHKRPLVADLSTVVHIFSECYANDMRSRGFGDFLRGTYFLLDHMDQNPTMRLELAIVSHPMVQLFPQFNTVLVDPRLNQYTMRHLGMSYVPDMVASSDPNVLINLGSKPDPNAHTRFSQFLPKAYVKPCRHYCVNTNDPPIKPIPARHRAYLRERLTPSEPLEDLVLTTLSSLGLVQQPYVVIHLRLGDVYLDLATHTYAVTADRLIHLITQRLQHETRPWLLLTDNNAIKPLIQSRWPQAKMLDNPIAHTGETEEHNMEHMKNTFLEFFLMSRAADITAYSVYQHGSGFSKWCAVSYDIPYVCYYLPDDQNINTTDPPLNASM